MLKSDIPEMVELLHSLKKTYKIYGLTNWSAETISIAYKRYPFFKVFDGIVVSGEEKMIKPNKDIFQLLLDRYHLKAASTVFIDDNINNVKAAEEIGFRAIRFESASQAKKLLNGWGVI